tara:strand:+ start:93 stop:413 length:321 start_codon:yes stop_codon:yes gene_type:complete
MKILKNNFLSLMLITCFIFFAIGSIDEPNSGSSKSKSSSSSSSSYSKPKKSKNDKVCQDAYGQWHSYISQCYTCGTSYCVQYLPYGKYCSQSCCAAYEGISSKCGY